MSIDVRGRTAVQELREVARGVGVPPPSTVVRAATRRRRRRVTGLVTACAALGVAGLLAGPHVTAAPDRTVSTPTPSASFGLACQMSGMWCADGRIWAAGPLMIPVSFVPAAGVNTDDISPGQYSLEVRLAQAKPPTGITVFEDAIPLDGTRDRPVPSLVGADAKQVAAWLASRPFVLATTPKAVEVGGLPAYRVDVTLRPGSTLRSFANGYPAALTFVTPNGWGSGTTASVAERLRNTTYFLVDVPGRGFAVIWVWSWTGTAQDVASMARLVDSYRFG